MKTLNNILYPSTSIWNSDVWDKDVIFESVIPEPEIHITHFKGSNISSHEHVYPWEHTDEKGTKHSGEVTITHYRLTNPSAHHNEDEDSPEFPGGMEITFTTNPGKSTKSQNKYKSVGKESIPPKARAAIGAKIRGIVEHHVKTRGVQFAEEMKKDNSPAFLRAEGYEPGASENKKAAQAAYDKHIAYGKMFKSLAKRMPHLFHPFKLPEPNEYEDITGYHGILNLHFK